MLMEWSGMTQDSGAMLTNILKYIKRDKNVKHYECENQDNIII